MLSKNTIFIFSLILFCVFIGYVIGSQHVPFTNSLHLIYTENFAHNNEKFNEIPTLIKETNVKSIIKIENKEDIKEKRNQLISFIWKSDSLPYEFPSKIINNFNDERFSNIKNLERIDKIIIEMENGINSNSYLFHPIQKNNKLLIYHQGHSGDFINGKHVIAHFIDQNYTVLAFSMPLFGENSKPIITTDFGVMHLDSHNKLRFLDSKDFSSMKYFFHPILTSINYVEEHYSFETIDMIGLSGGSWTITIYSAIDERISKIFPVGGPLPLYIAKNSQNNWHYETSNLSMYEIANYLEIFIMSSVGENKTHVKILNKYDSCCNYGISYTTFENDLKKISNTLGGNFQIYLDDTHSRHMISDYSIKVIDDYLNSE